jgi:hypothetical protein
MVPAPPRAASLSLQGASRRVSYIEAIDSTASEYRPRHESVKTVTHISKPERLQREPIRIVSPDGSAGRMYR